MAKLGEEALDWNERANILRATFTPAAPVTNKDLFAGRVNQLVRLWDTIQSAGEHGAVFGERGVGKTSLARNAEAMAVMSGCVALRINCQANDAIQDIWRRISAALDRQIELQRAGPSRPGASSAILQRASELMVLPGNHEVLLGLEVISTEAPVVIFLDEYDRVGDGQVETDLVDIMKTVADQGLPVTIVIVGVAADVDALITEHESIGRGFNEIEMPRMSVDELRDVVKRGLEPAGMTTDDDAATFIAQLSIGLPHYAHLMGLHAGLVATAAESLNVESVHVLAALPSAVERAQQHVSRLYHEAVHSTRTNMYSEVLLSAALTPTDERGYFAPGDMREPLSTIVGRPMNIPAFANHLSQFATDRGPVLERSGKNRRPRYRFTEPLLIPYVTMRSVKDGLITATAMRSLLSRRYG